MQPAIEDVWIKTAGDGLERRKLAKNIVVHKETNGVRGSQEEKIEPVMPVAELPSQDIVLEVEENSHRPLELACPTTGAEECALPPTAMDSDKEIPIPGMTKSPKTGLMEFNPAPLKPEVLIDESAALKRPAEKISTESAVIKEDTEVEPEGEHAKLAVILRFSLGSSQYATIALRELMKESGVQNYKPDFSRGR